MSEEKTSTQIYGMLNNYQLADTANIARADALQTFNYAFREQLEDYLTFTEGELNTQPAFALFEIKKDSGAITFDQLKIKFEENILLNTNAVSDPSNPNYAPVFKFVAQNTINNFQEMTYGKYRVEINDKGPDAQESLFNALKIVINKQGSGFLEIVDCIEASCPKGSFYFNIPLNLLTDEEYELIPRIIVKDTFTQEQIKMAILPKTNIKVYVPLRFFKVLNESMDAARGINAAHAKNAEFKLGFCDTGYCAPRTNPLGLPASTTWTGKNCPTSEEPQWIVTLDPPSPAGITNYFAGGSSSGGNVGRPGILGYGAVEVCDKSKSANAFVTDSDDFFVKDTDLTTDSERMNPISGCGYNKLVVMATPEVKATVANAADQRLFCGRIISLAADIVFVDSNPNFLVRGTSRIGGVKTNMYKIRVTDNSFDPAEDATYAGPGYYCNTGSDKCTPS